MTATKRIIRAGLKVAVTSALIGGYFVSPNSSSNDLESVESTAITAEAPNTSKSRDSLIRENSLSIPQYLSVVGLVGVLGAGVQTLREKYGGRR